MIHFLSFFGDLGFRTFATPLSVLASDLVRCITIVELMLNPSLSDSRRIWASSEAGRRRLKNLVFCDIAFSLVV